MAVRKARRKGSLRALTVFAGMWFTLLAAYGQVGCENEEDTNPDGGISDASNDATDPGDTSADVTIDSPGPDVGDFDDAAGSYKQEDAGCGLADFVLALTSGIEVNPFGANGAVKFTLKSGSTNVAEATGLIIFSAPNHTCSLTETAAGAIRVDCTNPSGGSCTQAFKR